MLNTLMEGIAAGELSAPEAAGLAKAIQGFTQALDTAELGLPRSRRATATACL